MSEYFSIPDSWILPDFVWRQSFDDMAIDGLRGCEGVALWLGRVENEIAIATQVVLLRGHGVLKRPFQLAISADLMNRVSDVALEKGLFLVGQIHSHSPLASTDLSNPDRYLGITEPGYLSLVAPNFAQAPSARLEDCGVHVHEGESGWRKLHVPEIRARFEQPSVTPVPALIVSSDT
jgi:proteasome lid subunit RPN8/RPN11